MRFMSTLRIRHKQVEALALASRETFEDNVMNHLRRVWPEETAALGDGALRTRVRHGIAEGGRYEIETEFDVARLLDLMFVFDLYFDGGGAPPWAARTLSDPLLDGRQRVDALMVRAQKFFNDIARGRQRPPQRAGS